MTLLWGRCGSFLLIVVYWYVYNLVDLVEVAARFRRGG